MYPKDYAELELFVLGCEEHNRNVAETLLKRAKCGYKRFILTSREDEYNIYRNSTWELADILGLQEHRDELLLVVSSQAVREYAKMVDNQKWWEIEDGLQ